MSAGHTPGAPWGDSNAQLRSLVDGAPTGVAAMRDAEIEILKAEVSRLRGAITCHQEHMLETAEEVVGADRALWKVLDD